MTSQCLRQLELANDIIIQGHCIELGDLKLKVYTVMGVHDNLEVRITKHLNDYGAFKLKHLELTLFISIQSKGPPSVLQEVPNRN